MVPLRPHLILVALCPRLIPRLIVDRWLGFGRLGTLNRDFALRHRAISHRRSGR